MRIDIISKEIKKSDRIHARVRPETKDEMIMAAHELGVSLSDLIEMSFFHLWKEKASSEERRKAAEENYKLMEKVTRRARPVRRAAIEISHKESYAKLLREIEKLALPPLVARDFYEDLLAQVRSSDELTLMTKEVFREAYNIPEPLFTSENMSVYPDLIRINTCGLYPIAHRKVDKSKLNERITIVLANFPSCYYDEVAELQRKIWNLCRKEKTI